MPGVAGVPASYEEEGSCAGVPGVLGSKKLVVRGVDGVLEGRAPGERQRRGRKWYELSTARLCPP